MTDSDRATNPLSSRLRLEGPQLKKLAKWLVDEISGKGIPIRIFGGVGVKILCPHMVTNGFIRQYPFNIDIVARSQNLTALDSILQRSFQRVTWEPYASGEYREYRCNWEAGQALNLDVYFGTLRFAHDIPGPYFCQRTRYTLPITGLLLSKLAIKRLKHDDYLDIAAILAEHGITPESDAEGIRAERLQKVWSSGCSGWGLNRTCMETIERTKIVITANDVLAPPIRDLVLSRLQQLERISVEGRKSLLWKMRNVMGERQRWYRYTDTSENLQEG